MPLEPSSDAADVEAPVTLVELSDLKTKTGKLVRVYAERVDVTLLLEAMRSLPGAAPVVPEMRDDEQDVNDEKARKWLGWADALIPKGTFLVMADGREVRPAFHFDEAPTGHSIPGRYLTVRDRSKLMRAILALSGWTEEAAAPAAFHGGERERGGDGAGSVGDVEGVGPDPVGGAA